MATVLCVCVCVLSIDTKNNTYLFMFRQKKFRKKAEKREPHKKHMK